MQLNDQLSQQAHQVLSQARAKSAGSWYRQPWLRGAAWFHPDLLGLASAERESLLAETRADARSAAGFLAVVAAGLVALLALASWPVTWLSPLTGLALGFAIRVVTYTAPFHWALARRLAQRRRWQEALLSAQPPVGRAD